MKKNIGIITIGQSPRTDILPIIHEYIDPKVIYHVGVLDGLSSEKIESLAPEVDEKQMLTSLLKNGHSVLLSQQKILPLLKKKIIEAEEQGCKFIWLLCTGSFPELKTEKSFLIEPDQVISELLKVFNQGEFKLGVLLPKMEQQIYVAPKYQGIRAVVYTNLSPYELHTQDKLNATIDFFRKEQCDLIILDCMGYQPKLKKLLQEATQTKVILPNQLISSMLASDQ
ncbi:AroM family protein [Enterococcus rivorum]|uniref:AroM protein n=1 Tax=Enterococcus rivorum TaxID=762845 RepID=A0A1E5KZG3_9ENTE|nr:AroM family protein [Enterococcus rivorum]MBP2099373.1 protein AroM [Enterococcus rivorum]OEH83238.1 hypothetical protein BCR26_10565 [Enterococcus rivorum]